MTAGQIACLVLSAALIGAVGGAWLATIIISLKAGTGVVQRRRLDAYAEWLSAWRTLSRASLSFVAAFRALAADPRQSPYHTLRQDEAQRSRAAWCEAMAQLDKAEAHLLVWSDDPEIRERMGSLDRPTPECLRAAINGEQELTDRLRDRLRADDERAMTQVHAHSLGSRDEPSRLFAMIRRGAGFLQAIVDQWSRG